MRKQLHKIVLTGAAALAVLAPASAVAQAPIYGAMAHNDEWSDIQPYWDRPTGIYQFPSSATGFAFTEFSPANTYLYYDLGAEAADYGYDYVPGPGIYTGTTFETFYYMVGNYGNSSMISTYDFDTKELSSTQNYTRGLQYLQGYAIDAEGTRYAVFFEEDLESTSGVLAKVTGFAEESDRTDIGKLANTRILGMTFSTDGKLYALRSNGDLVTIDTEDAQVTKIGSTGLDLFIGTQGLAFDNQTLYLSAKLADGTTGLYTISTENGAATKIVEYPGHAYVPNIFLLEHSAVDGAPAPVSDLSISFPNGEVEGKIIFTAPLKNINGEALTGELTYKVSDSYGTEETGTCTPGSRVEVDFTAEEGENTFSVTCSNATGTSNAVSISGFIGMDVPVMKSVTLKIDDETGLATLTWTIESEGVNGGYVDADAVEYTIIRNPGKETVAGGFEGTEYVEMLDKGEPVAYNYIVTPICGFKEGEPMKSNVVILGEYFKIPFSESFTDPESFDLYKVIDANKDGNTWTWIDTMYEGEPSQFVKTDGFFGAADDWLVTPLIRLYKDVTYTLSVDLRKSVDDRTERLDVGFGLDFDVANYSLITKDRSISPNSKDLWNTYERTFTVPANGYYHIGFHSCGSNGYYILMDNIKINGSENELDVRVEEINSDANEAPVYYDLQGRRVNNPAAGLYIEKRGNTIRKVIISQ